MSLTIPTARCSELKEKPMADNNFNEKTNNGKGKILEQRLDRIIDRLARIENDIRTLTWMSSIGFVCLGVLLVLLKPF